MKKIILAVFILIIGLLHAEEKDKIFLGKTFVTGMMPVAVTVDSIENIYIADRFTKSILKYDKNGKYLFSFGLKPKSKEDGGFYPVDLFYKDENIYVLDISGRIVVFDEDGQVKSSKKYKTGNLLGEISGAKAIFVDDDYIYLADTGNNRIQILDRDGMVQSGFGYKGALSGKLEQPEGVAVSRNEILVADTGNNIVSIYEKNGIFKKNISIDGEKLEEFKQPKSIIAGEDGNIYILDSGSSKIKVFDSNYKFLYLLGSNKVNGNGKKRIEDIWIAGKKIYIADSLRKKIKVYDENMNFIREVGRGSAAEILIKAGLIALVIIVAFILLKKEKHFKGEI